MASPVHKALLCVSGVRLLLSLGLFIAGAFAGPLTGSSAGLAHAADDPIGTILATSGNNLIDRFSGAILSPRAGSRLHARDTIRTGPRGHLQLRFVDGAIVALRPATVFRIDEYRWPSAEPRSFLRLLRGALRTATGALGKISPQSYRLTTPSATIGVRGTHYVVREVVCDAECPDGQVAGMHVSVREGGLVVTNDAGRIELTAGQSARVPSPMTAPVRTAQIPVLSARPMQAKTRPVTSEPAPGHSRAASETRSPGIPFVIESVAAKAEPRDRFILSDRLLASLADPAPEKREPVPSDTGSPTPALALAPRAEPVPAPEPAPTPAPQPEAPAEPTAPRADGELGGLADPGGKPSPADQDTPILPPVNAAARQLTPGSFAASRWHIALRSPPFFSGAGWLEDSEATVSFDEHAELSSLGVCPGISCLSRGTARVADAGRDAYVAWGRWTDGSLQTNVMGLTDTVALSDRESMHYLIGAPATSLPAQGSFTYPMIGATAPTSNRMGWAPGSFTGAASVQFAPGVAARIGLEGQVNIAYETFGFATRGGVGAPGQSELQTDAQARFSGAIAGQAGPSAPWYCGQGNCSVQIDGSLLGPNGERLGLGYSITSESGSTTIDGVAVFARP